MGGLAAVLRAGGSRRAALLPSLERKGWLWGCLSPPAGKGVPGLSDHSTAHCCWRQLGAVSPPSSSSSWLQECRQLSLAPPPAGFFLPALPSQQPSPGAAARQDLARCRDSPAALRGDEQGGRGSQLGDTGHLWQLSPCCQLPAQGPSEHRAPWQQLLRGIIPSWRAARAERSAGGGAAVVRSIFASCPPPKNPRRDAALGSAAGHGLGPLRPQEASLPPPPPLGNPCPGDAGLQQCVGPCSSGEQLQHPKVGADHRSPQSPGIPRRGWGALQGSQSSILCSILRAPPRHPKAGLLPDPIPPSGGEFWGRSGWVRYNGTGMD